MLEVSVNSKLGIKARFKIGVRIAVDTKNQKREIFY